MNGPAHRVNSDFTLEQFTEHATQLYREHGYVTFTWETGQQRSPVQDNALHVYCRELAKALNDAGWDMKKVLAEKAADVPWTEHSVKDCLWRPIQQTMTGHKSTTQPKRKEYSETYETLARHMGQKFGVYVPWPVKERKAA